MTAAAATTVLRKDDNDLVKKYIEYEMECVRYRPKKTWTEVVEKDSHTQ